jgi:hemoglobin
MNEQKNPYEDSSTTANGIEFSHKDIYKVVDQFYTRVQEDPLLKVPFSSVHDWPDHIKRLTHFWWLRFGGPPYLFNNYNPVLKHFFAGFNRTFLERWLFLFHDTIKINLNEKQADLWTLLSERMGEGLSIRNDMFKRDYEAKHSSSKKEGDKND